MGDVTEQGVLPDALQSRSRATSLPCVPSSRKASRAPPQQSEHRAWPVTSFNVCPSLPAQATNATTHVITSSL